MASPKGGGEQGKSCGDMLKSSELIFRALKSHVGVLIRRGSDSQ